MACHIRIASDTARFGQPEISLGILPGWGGNIRLPRIVGRGKAIELILTGDMIPAQEAARLNLVNKVVPAGQVVKTAMDLAKKLVGKSALAVAAILETIDYGMDVSAGRGAQEGSWRSSPTSARPKMATRASAPSCRSARPSSRISNQLWG